MKENFVDALIHVLKHEGGYAVSFALVSYKTICRA